MHKYLLTLSIIFTTTAQSKLSFTERQNLLLAKLNTTNEIITQESLAWEEKFYESLINDADPNIQVLGHKENMKLLKIAGNKDAFIELATSVNEILSHKALSPKSLKNIETLCDYPETQPHCNHDLIFEKQLELTPDNAFIYLNGLYNAVENHDLSEIKAIINDLENAKYIDTYNYPDPAYREKLETYVKENPFSKNKLELEKFWIFSKLHTSTPEQNQIVSDNMERYMIMIFINIIRMSDSIPNYRSLADLCKTNPNYEKSCLKISKTFINRSKSTISKHIGYAIKSEILKQQGKTEESLRVEKNKLSYKNNYECLARIMNYGKKSYFFNGPQYNIIAEPIERELGEVAFFKSIAQQNYAFYTSKGNKEIMNPENCD